MDLHRSRWHRNRTGSPIPWSEWTRRLPHVDFRLPNMPLHWPDPAEVEAWTNAFADEAVRRRRQQRRRQWLAGATLVVLLGAFRVVDIAITRWTVGSTPPGHWASEAMDWSELAWTTSGAAGVLPLPPEPAQSTVSGATGGVEPGEESRQGQPQRFVRVVVTGYSSTVAETDDDPHVTAWNTRPQAGTLALSRDLLRTFTPGAPFDFGDKILIPGVGVYRVEDTMSGRWRRRADLWFESTARAREWGQRAAYVSRIPDETPILALRTDP